MKRPLIEVEQISKEFHSPQKVTVLSDVSFELYPQTSLAIMGASGEGKTTLLYILGALENADTGNLKYNSQPIEKWDLAHLRNEQIGFIFQSYNLMDDFTVMENILMPVLIAREPTQKNSEAYIRAKELLKRVGLENRAHFPAKHLSGGEKQRVCIARALINNPSLILADEPTGNLDHQNSAEIHRLLFGCVQELKKGLILVTHDRELAQLCDQTMVLRNGKLSSIEKE